jgi:glycosyltransferase involved in cell wall biosynthesis
MRPTIGAIIVAKNEAANIERCLNSLAWCDERFVVDDHSTDATAEIAARCGARVATHKFESFARQRNWAIENVGAQSDWLLMLDADEVSTPEFARNVESAVKEAGPTTVGFRTCRKTMFLGRWLKRSDGFPVWIMRIVRKGQPLFADAGHGEIPVPLVNGDLGTIAEPFLHFAFSKGLSDWLERHNRYSSREADREFHCATSPRLAGLWASDRAERRQSLRNLGRRVPARSTLRFLYQYVVKLGFLDGKAGLMFCSLMAYYEWLIVLKRKELEARAQGIEL